MTSSEEFKNKANGLIYKIRNNTDVEIEDNIDFLQEIIDYAREMQEELEDDYDD